MLKAIAAFFAGFCQGAAAVRPPAVWLVVPPVHVPIEPFEPLPVMHEPPPECGQGVCEW